MVLFTLKLHVVTKTHVPSRPSVLGVHDFLGHNKFSREIAIVTRINIIQIMTDHESNRKIYLARAMHQGLETVDYYPKRSFSRPDRIPR